MCDSGLVSLNIEGMIQAEPNLRTGLELRRTVCLQAESFYFNFFAYLFGCSRS